MAVAIGVTGHRILTEVDKLNHGIEEALKRVETSFPGRMIVISSLAEGADRLVVERVLAHPAATLIVPLPLPAEDYKKDFCDSASKAEFDRFLNLAKEVFAMPPAPSRNEAYEAAGQYVLDHCDVLLAVWDGQSQQGIGGTGGIVARARLRGLPTAWVHAGNRKPGTLEPTTLIEEQGKVTYENF